MKRILPVLLLFVLNTLVAQETFTIKGSGFETGQALKLSAFEASSKSYQIIDETTVQEDGQFVWQIPFSQPNLYQLQWGEKKSVKLSIEAGTEVELVLEDEKLSIKGDELNQLMRKLPKSVQDLQVNYFGSLKKEIDKAMSNGDQEKAEALMQKANSLLPQFVADLRQLILAFGESPATYWALQFSDINKDRAFFVDRIRALQKALPDSPITQALANDLADNEMTAIGKTLPPISGQLRSGEQLDLNSLQAKLVFIDFWASWCRACRVENPKFAKLYQNYHKAGFEILSISSDEKNSIWEKAIKQDGVGKWLHLSDPDMRIFDQFGVSSLPQNLLVNNKGIIIAKNVDADQLGTLLAEQLK